MSHTPLTKAPAENNYAKFVELIGKGANVNERDDIGSAPIHWAIRHQDERIARFIMALPQFDINLQRAKSGQTPLMYAIAFHRRELAQDLLARKGINILLKDAGGNDIYDHLKVQRLTMNWLFYSAKKQGEGVPASTSASSITSVASLSSSLENPILKEKVRESKKNDLAPLKDKVSPLPEATKFISSTGDFAIYYFKNNPWKFSEDDNSYKMFRYCIICGDNRFSDDVWSRQFNIDKVRRNALSAICEKSECYKNLCVMPVCVPRKHYMVETPEDQRKAEIWPKQQPDSYEDIEMVTCQPQSDKVFTSESDIPPQFFEIFLKLEKIPVQHRISEIDKVYLEYAEKNKRKWLPIVDITELDVSDPFFMNHFLKLLVGYRNRSCEILESIRKQRVKASL